MAQLRARWTGKMPVLLRLRLCCAGPQRLTTFDYVMKSVLLRTLGGLAVILVCLTVPEALSAPKGKRHDAVLILHDSSGPFGRIGGLHARMLANLLGHFDIPLQIIPVESYPAGAIGRSRAVFYIGSTYDNPLS